MSMFTLEWRWPGAGEFPSLTHLTKWRPCGHFTERGRAEAALAHARKESKQLHYRLVDDDGQEISEES